MENSTGGVGSVTKWDPARLISHDHGCEKFALLILNQPLDNLPLLKSLWERGIMTSLRPHQNYHTNWRQLDTELRRTEVEIDYIKYSTAILLLQT